MRDKKSTTDLILNAAKAAGWAPALVFTLHVIVSRGFDAYITMPALDIPMHFLGGIAICYFFFSFLLIAVEKGPLGRTSFFMTCLFAFALTTTSTVFWEFAEFLSDRSFGTHSQLDLDDTLGDMLVGMAGGMSYLLINFCLRGLRVLRGEWR